MQSSLFSEFRFGLFALQAKHVDPLRTILIYKLLNTCFAQENQNVSLFVVFFRTKQVLSNLNTIIDI